mmetsp:Transcript_67567/g.154978  ORF Transcript_67567/g.154978 Transcript_67567/m.154978 type:complete len:251 (-) Transcript_67567:676-1428(-)
MRFCNGVPLRHHRVPVESVFNAYAACAVELIRPLIRWASSRTILPHLVDSSLDPAKLSVGSSSSAGFGSSISGASLRTRAGLLSSCSSSAAGSLAKVSAFSNHSCFKSALMSFHLALHALVTSLVGASCIANSSTIFVRFSAMYNWYAVFGRFALPFPFAAPALRFPFCAAGCAGSGIWAFSGDSSSAFFTASGLAGVFTTSAPTPMDMGACTSSKEELSDSPPESVSRSLTFIVVVLTLLATVLAQFAA